MNSVQENSDPRRRTALEATPSFEAARISFDPAGTHFPATSLRENILSATVGFGQLKKVMDDPRFLQPKKTKNHPDLALESKLNALIQRLFTGAKLSNVAPFADYIAYLIQNARAPGALPAHHIWCPTRLTLVPADEAPGVQQYVIVPDDAIFLSIDAQTQLAAFFELLNRWADDPDLRAKLMRFKIPIIIYHGVDVAFAQQAFHDLNNLAVAPNTAVALAMDTRDPLMQIVRRIELRTPALKGRIDTQSRQLSKKSPALMSVQTARQFVANVALGMAATQYGSKPIPRDALGDESTLKLIETVAEAWMRAILDKFEAQIADRERFVIGAGSVLAAIGALGHQLLDKDVLDPARRDYRIQSLVADLETVNWSKTSGRWEGIAGKSVTKQQKDGSVVNGFTVGGTKEVSYNVYNALTDTKSVASVAIRR